MVHPRVRAHRCGVVGGARVVMWSWLRKIVFWGFLAVAAVYVAIKYGGMT